MWLYYIGYLLNNQKTCYVIIEILQDTISWQAAYLYCDRRVRSYCPALLKNESVPLRYPDLAAVCRDPRTLIMYPGLGAQNLEELLPPSQSEQPDPEARTAGYNVILIDGTWSQAKDIFLRNSLLHLPKRVCVRPLSWHLKIASLKTEFRGGGKREVREREIEAASGTTWCQLDPKCVAFTQ